MKIFFFICLLLGTASSSVFADGMPARKFARMPSVKKRCVASPCMFGDPVITTAQNTISFDRNTDFSIDMPNGGFSFERSFVSDTDALGQVESTYPPVSYCSRSVLADLVAPFGASSPNYSHNLQSLVDTRCPTHTRVMTPDGDIRFFGPVPTVAVSGSAWLPRLVGEGAGEPSRLKVSQPSVGQFVFQWFDQGGESYTYALQGPVYRLSTALNSQGTELYSVNYQTICTGKVEPSSVFIAGTSHVVLFSYSSCALSSVSIGPRTLVSYVGPVATFAESGTPGGWVDYLGLDSSKRSLVHPPEDLADVSALAGLVTIEQRHIHTQSPIAPRIDSSSEGWWGAPPPFPAPGALPSTFGAFLECGGSGQTCCSGNRCSNDGCCVNSTCVGPLEECPSLGGVCMDGSCGGCGGGGEDCCGNGQCTRTGSICGQNLSCEDCGGVGQNCCSNGCNLGLSCNWGLCEAQTSCVTESSERAISTAVAGGTVTTRMRYARGGISPYTGQPYGLGADYAPQPVRISRECSGFSDPYKCQPRSVEYTYGHSADGVSVNLACGVPGQPTSLVAVKDESLAYTVFPSAFTSASGGNFEGRTRYFGATSSTGANALATTWQTFSYSGDRQELTTVEEPSVLAPGQRAGTTRKFDPTTGLLSATIRSGYRRDAASGTIGLEYQAVFYRYGSRCSGWNDVAGRRRVSSIEGPCKVSSVNATSCQGSGWLVSDLYYYDTQPPPFAYPPALPGDLNDGRLAVARVFPNGCGSGYLESTYANYTAEGMPRRVTTPDGVAETTTSSGKLTTAASGRDPSNLTNIALQWDRGNLQKVTHGNGEYWRACYGSRENAAVQFFPICPKGTARTMGEPMWLGHFSADGTPREHYRLLYSTDQRLSRIEFYAVGASAPLWWRTIGTDADRAVVSSILADKLPTVYRRDVRGQVTAFGSSFDFANPAMPTSAPLSCLGASGGLCKQLTYDRLGRTNSLIKPAANGSSNGDSIDCLAYDAQGNLSSYARGCSPFACGNNSITSVALDGNGTLSVTGGPSCSLSPVTYGYDDFGELISVTQKFGAALSETRLDYDSRGMLVKRATAAQRSSGASTRFTSDALGRVGLVEEQQGGVFVTLVQRGYDQASLPPICAAKLGAANAVGRLAYEGSPLWKTWFSYDAAGHLSAELRLLSSQSDCTANESQYWSQTRYTYGYRGRLEVIQYPFGRRVKYKYPLIGAEAGRSAMLPTGIDVEVFSATSSSYVAMVSDIVWEADGVLKSYRAPTFQAQPSSGSLPTFTNVVSYEYAGSTNVETPPSACAIAPASGSDGTRRLRRIQVVSQDGLGAHNDQWYTWTGDQVTSVDRCYWGMSTPLNEYRVPVGERGFTFLGDLNASSSPTAGGALPQASRIYTYDKRGNRLSVGHHLTQPAKGVLSTFVNADRLDSTQAASVTSTLATPIAGSKDSFTYQYDADGRVTGKSGAIDSTGLVNSFVGFTFPYAGSASNGGYDSVIRAVTLDGVSYFNYYYDGSNRRVRKQYPSGAEEDYFYGPAGNLISERSFTFAANANGNTVDEYVWLAGVPIGSLRSVFDGNMVRVEDWYGYANALGSVCPRRNENARCGWYWLNPDRLGRPTMVTDKNYKIAGAGEYDVFGAFSRVEQQNETPHPYLPNQVYSLASGVTRTPFYYALRFRVRFPFADLKTLTYTCGRRTCFSFDYVRIKTSGGADLYNSLPVRGALLTPWMPLDATVGFDVSLVTDTSQEGSGVVMGGWDYLRTDIPNGTTTTSMPYFPPLRFPGQYFDEETGLHENRNRFYDPSLGRYLSPEPLLQSPGFVRARLRSGQNVPTYAYAQNSPQRYVDRTGLWTQVLVTIDSSSGIGIGTHMAMRVDNNGNGSPVIFDPGGSFNPDPDNDSARMGTALTGEDANLAPFIDYHRRLGESVLVLHFNTTAAEEAELAKAWEDEDGFVPDYPGGMCAITTSNALEGVGPFKGLSTSLSPARVSNQLLDIATSWSLYGPKKAKKK
jgi:RHS repeat-associated protein